VPPMLGAARRVQECAVNFFWPTQTLPTLGLLVRFPQRVGKKRETGEVSLYGEASSALRTAAYSSGSLATFTAMRRASSKQRVRKLERRGRSSAIRASFATR